MNPDDLAGYFQARTVPFWKSVAYLNDAVDDLLTAAAPGGVAGLFEIQARIRAKVDKAGAMTRTITSFADALLTLQDLPARSRRTRNEAFRAAALALIEDTRAEQGQLAIRHLTGAARTRAQTALDKELDCLATNMQEHHVEVLMENLTAAWLALYFLGVPMIQPWDGARRLAALAGGYPAGACVYKYIGDIYRTARHQVVRERGERGHRTLPPQAPGEPLVVLTYRPLALLEADLGRTAVVNLTPRTLQLLGQRYAMLQMRLYTQQGFPIQYFVPGRALGRTIHSMLRDGFRREGVVTEEQMDDAVRRQLPRIAGNIHAAMARNFRSEAGSANQTISLLPAGSASGIPTCVLGAKTGMYSLDQTRTALHYAGNQIRGDLLKAYRKKLRALDGRGIRNMQDMSAEEIGVEIAKLVDAAMTR